MKIVMRGIQVTLAAVACVAVLCPAARADVKEMSVTVKGVTCPVCTQTINIGLRGLRGVKTVKISLATRVNVEVTPQSGAWIDPERIFRQIASAGFQPKTNELRLRLQGEVSIMDGCLTLTLFDVGPKPINFVLTAISQDSKDAEESEKALHEIRESLLADGARSRRVEVEGWWIAAPDREHTDAIAVTKVAHLP